MNNIIIGTAGHIDHGKTTLIKALTGRDTDRLAEEQKRGISIELGFTYFDLPDGRRAGIIDVPGHERFIKNMLAGVGGMDIVLLVIAADEGIMPQTREHLNILNILRVEKGIVVLTKIDMVEKEWLEMVMEDVKESLKNSFLRDAPIIPLSPVTGKGMDELVRRIADETTHIEKKNYDTIYRLNIDRAFSMTGFGTIVTGTLITGIIKEGQSICIYPAGIEGRVRSLQVHDEDVETAYAGQRLAVNIAGIKKGQIQRGDVIAPDGALQPTMMLDCRLSLIEDTPWTLKNRSRVRLHIGTKELMGRVTLLDVDELKAGEECYVQLRLEEPTVALRGDRFIMRSYSPMETIGGGIILEPNPPKRKRHRGDIIEELKLKERGEPLQVLEKIISLNSSTFPGKYELKKLTGKSAQELGPMLKELEDKGNILKFQGGSESVYVHSDYYSSLLERAGSILENFHVRFPLRSGMPAEEFRNRLFGSRKKGFVEEMLRNMQRQGIIKITARTAALAGFEIKLTDKQQSIKKYILELLEKDSYSPPGVKELLQDAPYSETQVQEVLNMLIETGKVKRIGMDTIFSKRYYDEAVQRVIKLIKENGAISLADLRDSLGTSRKYAMALLEEMDRVRITKRTGDTRVLY